ncbi:MAG: cysteine synthase family protein [Cyclobacteriaceae bacterium]|nr:cysteine synthase family protein [Cyclobacteriaceae bacterium HetDA_MAG_MS6]
MIETLIESKLQERVNKLRPFVGNTPLFPIQRVFQKKGVKILAKLEWQQLGGSVKARPAYEIFRAAISSGELYPGKKLLDASSGNTAIAYATIGAKLGVPVIICLPENASAERKLILKSLGAELIYTSKFGGTDDAQEEALRLSEEDPLAYFYADQYNNDANWRAHYQFTANEIWNGTDKSITHFITGLGTTGTFTGTSTRLKELNHDITTISLQPDGPLHGMEGWKHLETAKVPGIYQPDIADDNWFIETTDAYALISEVAAKEGLLISPSAAANLAGAIRLAKTLDEGVIVTTFPDNAEKYGEVLKTLF